MFIHLSAESEIRRKSESLVRKQGQFIFLKLISCSYLSGKLEVCIQKNIFGHWEMGHSMLETHSMSEKDLDLPFRVWDYIIPK